MSGIIAQNTLDNSGLVKAPEGGGAWNFIKKISASSAATTSFVDGSSDVVFDSTDKEYLFTFKSIHPSVNASDFMFQFSTDTGSSYGVSMTTTYFQTYHKEDGTQGNVNFRTGDVNALHNETTFQSISTADGIGTDADQSLSGFLKVYNPASTTFVKHWMANASHYTNDDGNMQNLVAGYVNTTSAVDAVQFKLLSGTTTSNIDDGDICLYGLTT